MQTPNELLPDGLQMDLLWTNASPTSAFSTQQISVNKDRYHALLFLFKRGTSGDQYVSELVPNSTRVWIVTAYNAGLGLLTSRQFVVEDGSTITFRNGYKQIGFGSDTISDDLVVPYQIYGVK